MNHLFYTTNKYERCYKFSTTYYIRPIQYMIHLCHEFTHINPNCGSRYWYKRMLLDRIYQPSVIVESQWLNNDVLHSYRDLPAIVISNYRKIWYKNGMRHRDNGLPAFIFENNYKKWYQHDVEYIPANIV